MESQQIVRKLSRPQDRLHEDTDRGNGYVISEAMEKNFVMVFAVVAMGLACLLSLGDARLYDTGDCPAVEPLTGFDMNKFLGVWYVIRKTATRKYKSSCITYNFTKGEEPGDYLLEQTGHNVAYSLPDLDHIYHYSVKLSVPDPSTPAKMQVTYHVDSAGSATFTIFMTDYETYAGGFTCQKLGTANVQSTTILSRSETLDDEDISRVSVKIYSYSIKLSTSNVDPLDLDNISQNECSKNTTENVNLNIDSDTFTPESDPGVLHRVREKIGDGIKYVVEGAKKLYHKVVQTDDYIDLETVMYPEPEAEWLP